MFIKPLLKTKKFLIVSLVLLGAAPAHTQTLTLYVDTKTKQVYTEPGEHRVKLGSFRQVEEEKEEVENKPSESAAEAIEPRWESLQTRAKAENLWASRGLIPIEKRPWAVEELNRNTTELEAQKKAIEEELAALERERVTKTERDLAVTEKTLEEELETREKALEEQLRELERELEAALERKEVELERQLTRAERALEAIVRSKIPALLRPEDLERPWYARIGIRGYTQFRYSETLSGDKDLAAYWPDPSVGPDTSFLIRRARLILFGNITEHLYLFLQPEFASTPAGSTTTHFAQVRDWFGDIFFDKKREFRLRIGQSVVPFGFENVQPSQIRLALERNDPLNSCCPDLRDIGAFFYWTPTHIRERFRFLIENNLKGTADYGMFGLGVYNGQGPNQFEQNDDFHVVSRFTYPFQFPNGQIFEAGVQALSGRFVPSVGEMDGVTPVMDAPDKGFQDQRLGVHAVLFPQPFGLQAEWNWGRGPQLNEERMEIETASLNGGYVQAMYKLENRWGTWFPFVRWQYFDGALKFLRNAPQNQVDDVEIGLEWLPIPEVEVTASYTMMDRTNVVTPPFPQFQADILRVQLQWNFF